MLLHYLSLSKIEVVFSVQMATFHILNVNNMTVISVFHRVEVFPLKRRPLIFTLFLLLLLSSCREGTPLPDEVASRSEICDVKMDYDGESTTIIQPAKAAEISLLSDLDKALMFPVKERTVVRACLSADGAYTISTEYATPEEPLQYPEGVMQLWPQPKYRRMLSENGKISYFNDLGEVIGSDFIINDYSGNVVQAVQSLLELKQGDVMNEQRFEAGLDSLALYGMGELNKNGDIITIKHTFEDNTAAISVINKKNRMQIGQINYDAVGNLTSLYMLKVDGAAPDVTWRRLYEVSFFDAVESNVRMKRQKITIFKSFSLSIN